MQKLLQHYLNCSPKQARATLLLLAIALLAIFSPWVYEAWALRGQAKHSFANEIAKLPKLQKNDSNPDQSAHNFANGENDRTRSDFEEATTNSLFYFDPNTLDDDGWKKLGLNAFAIGNVRKYLAKGGRYRDADGLKKIFGISPALVEKLMPYVRIEGGANNGYVPRNNYPTDYKKDFEPFVKKSIAPLDINTADTIQFESLPGIGMGYARRIVNYRQKLGGFYSVDQIAETYGLPDSTFQSIKKYLLPNIEAIKKLNINTDDYNTLKHPYISFAQAKAIVVYRKQHGNFNSKEDLKKVLLITDETYTKIAPYISLQ